MLKKRTETKSEEKSDTMLDWNVRRFGPSEEDVCPGTSVGVRMVTQIYPGRGTLTGVFLDSLPNLIQILTKYQKNGKEVHEIKQEG